MLVCHHLCWRHPDGNPGAVDRASQRRHKDFRSDPDFAWFRLYHTGCPAKRRNHRQRHRDQPWHCRERRRARSVSDHAEQRHRRYFRAGQLHHHLFERLACRVTTGCRATGGTAGNCAAGNDTGCPADSGFAAIVRTSDNRARRNAGSSGTCRGTVRDTTGCRAARSGAARSGATGPTARTPERRADRTSGPTGIGTRTSGHRAQAIRTAASSAKTGS